MSIEELAQELLLVSVMYEQQADGNRLGTAFLNGMHSAITNTLNLKSERERTEWLMALEQAFEYLDKQSKEKQ